MKAKTRTIIYVDGFNFYYGAIRGGGNKWLDLAAYFTAIRNADNVVAINYFTTEVTGPTLANQQVYLRALATTPIVNIILGKFKPKEVECRVSGCGHCAKRKFTVPIEKRTDVNIALQMLEDAYEDRCDLFVVVSGDSDLVPAVTRVRSLVPNKKVIVYVPARDFERGAAVELRASANSHRTLPLNLLPKCQFPQTIASGGVTICKPASW